MLVSREREKMLNALIYFSENVRLPGKTKLFKLLNALDFEHFQKTGRSVTGLEYEAWKRGPVPKALYDEWKKPTQDFIDYFMKDKEQAGQNTREVLRPRKQFDKKLFSKFEYRLLENIAKRHFNDSAEYISEKSHFKTGCWDEVWQNGDGEGEPIPYELIVKRRFNEQDQIAFKRHIEDLEIRENYG